MNALRKPFLIQLIAVWLTTPQMSATSRAEKMRTFFSFFAIVCYPFNLPSAFVNSQYYSVYQLYP